MKKCLLILSILLFSCTNQNQHSGKTPTIPSNNTSINKSNTTESGTAKPLIIGGKQYYGPILDHSGEKTFTLNDIDDIKILVLYIDPNNSSKMKNLDGIEMLLEAANLETIRINGNNLDEVDLSPIEQFINITNFSIIVNGSCRVLPDLTSLKSLHILRIWDVAFDDFYILETPTSLRNLTLQGKNLHKVDLSVIETLHELTGLSLEGDITKLPDLTGLEKLRSITIENTKLESIQGIGAPNAKWIEILNYGKGINSLAPLNNLASLEDLKITSMGSTTLRTADMSNLPSLKNLRLYIGAQIDLQGIENLSMLEYLSVSEPDPFNIEGIRKLKNLRDLSLKLISPEPSLEFLRNMPNLSELGLGANDNSINFEKFEPYQILDISPLATLKNLRRLECTGFIIKNIATLDILDALSEASGHVYLAGSKFFDETEKSRHYLILEYPVRE